MLNIPSLKDAKILIGILIVNFFFFCVMPGWLAYEGKTYDTRLMLKNMGSGPKPFRDTADFSKVVGTYERCERYKNAVKSKIRFLEDSIASTMSGPAADSMRTKSVEPLLKEKIQLEKELGARPPVSILAFQNSPNMFLWWTVNSSLLFLLFLRRRNQGWKGSLISRANRDIGLAFLIFLLFYTPFVIRNFLWNTLEKQRIVYSFQHPDMDVVSGIYQLLTMFFFAWLIASLIRICVNQAAVFPEDQTDTPGGDIAHFLKLSDEISESYQKWFVESLILAVGFFSFTVLYWNLVFKQGDSRYIISAITAHFFWVVLWYFISLNLRNKIREYEKAKNDWLNEYYNAPDKNKGLEKVFEIDNPLNRSTLLITVFVSLLTLLSPLFRLILQP